MTAESVKIERSGDAGDVTITRCSDGAIRFRMEQNKHAGSAYFEFRELEALVRRAKQVFPVECELRGKVLNDA